MKFMELDIQRFAGSQYTLRCYKNDGSSEYVDTSVRGSEPIPRNTFTRDGYDFSGWNTKADGTGTGFYVTNLCDDVIAAADYDSENDVYILYTLWNKIVDKYVTFRGLQRYDTKIKDYIDNTMPTATSSVPTLLSSLLNNNTLNIYDLYSSGSSKAIIRDSEAFSVILGYKAIGLNDPYTVSNITSGGMFYVKTDLDNGLVYVYGLVNNTGDTVDYKVKISDTDTIESVMASSNGGSYNYLYSTGGAN